MASESDGALRYSSSEASDLSLPAVRAVVHMADAYHQRALLLKCVKKWRALHRKRRVQWKLQLLATHHAHYARLWTAFNVWRQRVNEACKRKQQIEAACAVGAGFFQRLFFQRWRAYVAQQKLEWRRQQLLLALVEKVKQRLLRSWFARWKAYYQRENVKREDQCLLQSRTRRAPGKQLNPRRNHLRVQGSAIGLAKQKQFVAAAQRLSAAPATANLQSDALRRLLEPRYKRHFFKSWRSAVSSIRRELEQKAAHALQIVHFQVQQAISRWKKRVSSARECALLEKRAFFFLYFCLAKKSLTQLKKHALLHNTAHRVAEMVNKRAKQRVWQTMVPLSCQRRCLRRMFIAWRTHSASRQQRIESQAIQSVKLLVYNKYRSRLLQEAFLSWRRQFVQKQVYAAVTRVVGRYRAKAMRFAWSRWLQLLAQLSRIQQWKSNRRVKSLSQVWVAWKLQAQRTTTKERNRRLAVRFFYQRLLRRAFEGFLTALHQTQVVAEQAGVMRSQQIRSMLVSYFAGWSSFVACRKQTTQKKTEAACFHRVKLLKRVLKIGWARFVQAKTLKRTELDTAQQHYNQRLQHKIFQSWKEIWMEQRERQELLNFKAASFVECTNRQRKARALQQWLEFLHKRQTSRLVSAHARGQWQLKLLHKSFSGWMARIAELCRQQIQNQRARQQYEAKLKQKCFQFWKRKLAALKHHRGTNRKALVHWKLTVERKAFASLKEYVTRKKCDRARMHDALEFRHRLIVSDGVQHWMTTALHLQAQRESHVSKSQAKHAARIWRLVARIARHWRALTVSRRVCAGRSSSVNSYTFTPGTPESWLVRQGQRQIGQHRAPPISVIGKENREPEVNRLRMNATRAAVMGADRPVLSEFVTLPKNRPQPRRPVDLLLVNAATGDDDGRQDPPPLNDRTTAVYNVDAGDLRTKYGFEFPTQPFQPLDMDHQFQQLYQTPVAHETRAPLRKQTADKPQVAESTHPPPPPPISQKPTQRESTLLQLDALEAQLQVWKIRKQELRALQDKIQSYQRHIQDPSLHQSSPSTVRQMQTELFTMEKQYDAFSNKWLVSKGRIRTINQEIRRLYAALQATK